MHLPDAGHAVLLGRRDGSTRAYQVSVMRKISPSPINPILRTLTADVLYGTANS